MKTVFKTKNKALKWAKLQASEKYGQRVLRKTTIRPTGYFCHCGETSGLSLWYRGETFNVGICKSCGDE